jgi:protein SCO1/2
VKRGTRRIRWAAALAGVLGALFLGACSPEADVVGAGSSGPATDPGPEDSAEFGALSDFRLRNERGEEVTRASLLGRPLVFGALFSTCTGPCPSIARGLKRLQDEFAATDVEIVVVSVDPQVDTPEVLQRYGERVGADPERWTFLTGAEADVHAFVRQGLFQAVARVEGAPSGERVTHDTRLLVVDRRGLRRGWYSGTDEVQLEKLRRRLRFLVSEPRPNEVGEPFAR